MSALPTPALLVLVVVGAAALALWVHLRFPAVAPGSLRLRALHLFAALLAVQLAAPVMALVPGVGEAALPATVALLGIFLPALVYAFLNAIWVVRLVQGAARLG